MDAFVYYHTEWAFAACVVVAGLAAIAAAWLIDTRPEREVAIPAGLTLVAAVILLVMIFGSFGDFEQQICEDAGYWHVTYIDDVAYCALTEREQGGPAMMRVDDLVGERER